MPFPAFDRSRLLIKPLVQREHDLDLSVVLPLDAPLAEFAHPALPLLGQRLVEARRRGSARIFFMGARRHQNSHRWRLRSRPEARNLEHLDADRRSTPDRERG